MRIRNMRSGLCTPYTTCPSRKASPTRGSNFAAIICWSSSTKHRAAVGQDRLPGYEAGGVRGQEHGQACHLRRLRHAAQRYLSFNCLLDVIVGPERLGELRLHQSRRDAVDADALAQLLSERFGHHVQAGLADAV